LLFECRQWRKERRTLYSDLRRLGVYTPRKSEKSPRDRLFNTSKATRPILDYIKATEIGYRPGEREEEVEEWRRLDRWDLDRLEGEE